MRFKVYRMIDPGDHLPFYIGQTLNLLKRFNQHMYCDGKNPQRDAMIQEIVEAGSLPFMERIELVETLDEALEREEYWIQYYTQKGIRLTNVAGVSATSSSIKSGRRLTDTEFHQKIQQWITTGVCPWRSPRRMRSYLKKEHGIIIPLPDRVETSGDIKGANRKLEL